MEAEWTPWMMDTLGIGSEELPIIWDADFLYGPRSAGWRGHLRALRDQRQLRVSHP